MAYTNFPAWPTVDHQAFRPAICPTSDGYIYSKPLDTNSNRPPGLLAMCTDTKRAFVWLPVLIVAFVQIQQLGGWLVLGKNWIFVADIEERVQASLVDNVQPYFREARFLQAEGSGRTG